MSDTNTHIKPEAVGTMSHATAVDCLKRSASMSEREFLGYFTDDIEFEQPQPDTIWDRVTCSAVTAIILGGAVLFMFLIKIKLLR